MLIYARSAFLCLSYYAAAGGLWTRGDRLSRSIRFKKFGNPGWKFRHDFGDKNLTYSLCTKMTSKFECK